MKKVEATVICVKDVRETKVRLSREEIISLAPLLEQDNLAVHFPLEEKLDVGEGLISNLQQLRRGNLLQLNNNSSR
jgi:hypothetical protein